MKHKTYCDYPTAAAGKASKERKLHNQDPKQSLFAVFILIYSDFSRTNSTCYHDYTHAREETFSTFVARAEGGRQKQ